MDPETQLVTKETYLADRPAQPLVEETFSDYRSVEGVQVAFAAERRIGTRVVKRRVSDIKINTPLDPALFKRPRS